MSNPGLPNVGGILHALPCHLAVPLESNRIRDKVAVQSWMPLRCQIRKVRLQAIARQDLITGTKGTSRLSSVIRCCRPFMAGIDWTNPPDLLLAGPQHHVSWSQVPILCWVPLRSKIGANSGKTVGDRNLLARAAGTATPANATLNDCLPFMIGSGRTAPPDFLTRSYGQVGEINSLVARRMQLREQVWAGGH
jgi:hypothetical protein